MNIFEQLREVNDLINNDDKSEYNTLFSEGAVSGVGFGANGNDVPWTQDTPWSIHDDFDHDGISDALDNYCGPGAWNK
jgi:hypothetical protein